MVRFKHQSWQPRLPPMVKFQFLYGAIQTSFETKTERSFFMFQFLYGAIQTVNIAAGVYTTDLFQFLYGAIQTLTSGLKTMSFICFNSYMVRFKLCCFYLR